MRVVADKIKDLKFDYLSVFAIAIICFIMSCCGGMNNESTDLNQDNYFRRAGAMFSYSGSHNELHSTIFPHVISYASDPNFVLVAQIPDRKYYVTLLASDLNTGKEQFKELETKADSILTRDPYHLKVLAGEINFWIIKNSSHELIGPMTLNQFVKKREELNVPDNLKLKLEL